MRFLERLHLTIVLHFMKTLLLFLTIIASQWGHTQNRVVKDNLACLYGIKNPDGAWVVKPKYILLTGYTYGYFVIQEGRNYGLLAQDGTELLSCEYTEIKPLNYKWQPQGLGQAVTPISTGNSPLLFQITKDNMRGLVDDSGNTVVPLDTQYFRTDGQHHVIITEYRKPNHFTSYIDLSGNYIFKSLPGAIEPFGNNQIALIGLRTPGSNGTVEGNVQVINKKGEYVVSEQFKRALVCGQGRIVFEDSAGHIGTMTMTGQIIIKPTYKLVFKSYLRQNILPCLHSAQHTFVIENDEGKFGLMNGVGKIVCAPKYDLLEKLQGQWKTVHTAWRVRNNGKLGMLDENGRASIPCNYDTLIPFKMRYGANTSIDGFIVSDSDKFGLIGIQGDTIIPLEHTFFEYAWRSQSILFGNLTQLSELTLVNDALHISPIEKLVQLVNHSVFKGKNDRYFVLKEAENGSLEMIRSERYMNVLSFQEARSKVILIDVSGKRLDEGNVHTIKQNLRFIVAQTTEGMRYLIDTKSAKQITVPSSKAQFQLQGSSMSQVWTKGIVEPRDSWILLDTNGQRAGTASFDQPFNLNTEQVSVRQGNYWGIYSVIEKEWLLSPKYTCIDAISQKVYKAKLQNGNWELHALGTETFFGPFESLELLCSSYEHNRYGSSTVNDHLFIASQKGKSILIDTEGKKISNPMEIRRIQIALAYDVYTHNKKSVSSRGIKIKHNEPDFNVTALYEQLYDTLQAMYPKPTKNLSLRIVDQRKCTCPKDNAVPLKNELSYVKSNAASVTISRYVRPNNSWDVGHYRIQSYINVILVNGQMKEVALRAIFGNNDQVLYNEFTRAITTNETLDLECSTVSNMLEIIQNNYRFSAEGLVLIVAQNSKRSVNVTIPWERLAEVPTTRSFAKIFID